MCFLFINDRKAKNTSDTVENIKLRLHWNIQKEFKRKGRKLKKHLVNLYLAYEAYNNKETELLSQSEPQDREELTNNNNNKKVTAAATVGTRQGDANAPPLFALICRGILRLKEAADVSHNKQEEEAVNNTTQDVRQQVDIKHSFKDKCMDNTLPARSPIANNSSITVLPDNKYPATTATDEIAQNFQTNVMETANTNKQQQHKTEHNTPPETQLQLQLQKCKIKHKDDNIEAEPIELINLSVISLLANNRSIAVPVSNTALQTQKPRSGTTSKGPGQGTILVHKT